ncbi:hypothetical protein [Candidatus Venteria ishoeyi]|uniref:Uncharacterized protein n=1 Tax=Candidatus Venteria ishoeyi TaxID=1899563 RepID=A0A1H6FFW5_9GAMM|nr:hypothetical protein [Candidatus Venteria ishoeyi]SEH08952.1 Uncharacterised protein [Candidatus Venteria ishoeyi]
MKKWYIFLISSLFLFAESSQAEKLLIKPERLWTKPAGEIQLQVDGGVLPLRWQTTSGQIRRKEKTDNAFVYTAPQRYMQDKVRFIDNAGQETVIEIDVLRPLTISPSQRTIPVNNSARFKVYGGSGEWQINNIKGIEVEKIDTQTLQVTAGSQSGEFILLLEDKKTQDNLDVSIIVYDALGVKQQD